tara:strand:- start:21494 stop:22438 length:945 start_codon:yes stop_codon:yes gene_type:complete
LNFSPEILCFASGGVDLGFGHLYRLTSLIKSLKLDSKVTFLVTNQIEREFLQRERLQIFNKKSDKNLKFKHVIIDSKYNCMNILDQYVNDDVNIIIIDNIEEWTKNATKIVVPSFFINQDDLERNNLSQNNRLHWGKPYSMLKEPKITNKKINNRILLTFGGSDPNNISHKILMIMKNTKYGDRLRLILGPGYQHSKSDLLKEIPDIEIIEDSKNMQKEISSASMIITSFGTTLQEVEFYGKKVIIGCNYDNDLEDFFWLKKYTRNKNSWKCLGNWNNLNTSLLYEFIEQLDLADEPQIDDDALWGKSWKELLS